MWRRRTVAQGVSAAESRLTEVREQLEAAQDRSAPHVADVRAAEERLQAAERDATSARLRERLDQLTRPGPDRTLERGIGIEL
ncbi:MAG: hypothetical protein M3N47_13840 [Chloroflexota bacterium]|nr:hypothetical protein [Chloroflexota bacterium]